MTINLLYLIPLLTLLTLITYKKPHYGIYIVLATIPAYLIKTQIWFIPTTWLELGIYTIALVMIIKYLKAKNLEAACYYIMNRAKPYVLPIALMLLGVLIATIISNNQARALGILKAWFFAPLLFASLFLNTITNQSKIRSAILFLSFSVWPIMLFGLYDFIYLADLTIPNRLDSFFSSPNYVVMYLVPIIILSLGWLITNRAKIKLYTQIYYALFLGLGLTTIFLTKSIGGWFSLLAGIFMMIILLPRITLKKSIITIITFLLSVLILFVAHQKTATHFDNFWQTDSFQTRKKIWTNSLVLTTNHPILGLGLADFKTDYLAHIQSLPKEKQPTEKEVLRPHNLYLDFYLETTLLGIIALIWIVLLFFRLNISTTAAVPYLASLTAILLHGLVDTPYFKNDLAILFWIIITLQISHKSKSPKNKNSWEIR